MTGPDLVFLGPSLTRDQAHEIVPDVVVLPPAAMGDVLAAVLKYRPHAIGLVDGTFLSTMSVFHKELLFAMEQGTWLLGASSMGALRAAECSTYGMIGVGQIYQDLASGRLEDDDEVALTHAGAEDDFRPLSDALVSIRATLAAANDAGLLTDSETQRLVTCQKDRWFPDRRLSTVIADTIEMGFAPDRVLRLREFVRTKAVDPKRSDAIALLQQMQQLPEGPMPIEARPKTVISGVFTATLARDIAVTSTDGVSVTFDRIRRYGALHDPNFAADMRVAKTRLVLTKFSVWLGGLPTVEECSLARDNLARQVQVSADGLDEWANSVDLDPDQLRDLIMGQALIERLENSWLARSRLGEITTPYLNHLRLSGRYQSQRDATAFQKSAAEGITFSPSPTIEQSFRSMAALGSWEMPDDLSAYVEAVELGSIAELLDGINLSLRAHQALFGIGLVDSDQEFSIVGDGEPLMSRGN